MTWQEFCTALGEVAEHGTLDGVTEDVIEAMFARGLIVSTWGDAWRDFALTPAGKEWHARVTAPTAEVMVREYAKVFEHFHLGDGGGR